MLYSEGRLGPLGTILDFYPVRKDLVYLLLRTVVSFKFLGAESSHYMDESSLVDFMEGRHAFTVPCGNIMPCGLDDRPAFLVFVGVIGSNGESDVLIVADSLEFDVSNVSSQFDFVDLFPILYWFLADNQAARSRIVRRQSNYEKTAFERKVKNHTSCFYDFYLFLKMMWT